MNRRCFLRTVSASLLAVPPRAGAQQTGKIYRIGFLRAGQPPETYLEGLRQGLRERGYDDQKITIDIRATDGSFEGLPRYADELVRSKVDVIVGSGAPAALAAKRATTSVPIVFVGVIDPVELGLVPRLVRPGGNITGLSTNPEDLAGKRLELLKTIVPKLRRVAVALASLQSDEPDPAQGGPGRGSHAGCAARAGADRGAER